MATKFLKIKSTGTLASKELDCAMLRFENSSHELNHAGTPAGIDTAAEFKKLLIVLDLGGADVASNYVLCFNFGTADRADAATHAQLFTGYSNKTIKHVDIGTSIVDTTLFSQIMATIRINVGEQIDDLKLTNIKHHLNAVADDQRFMVWNTKQSGVDADRPKWLVVTTDNDTPNLANNTLATTTGGSGAYASYIETEQFDEEAPSGGATYYLPANKTLVGYGAGVSETFTAADDATGTWYTDKQNNVVYLSAGETKFLVQDGSDDGDVTKEFAEHIARQVNSLRTFDFTISSTKLDSKFFDAVENDGLFPGGGAGFPTDLRNDFLGNRESEHGFALTPTLVNAGTSTNAATGETAHVANKVNRSFNKSSKAILELGVAEFSSGGQRHILTF